MTKVTLKSVVDRFADPRDCPFRGVLDHIGDKWTFLIFATLEDGPRRFSQIRRSLGDVSQRVLTGKLRSLERDGFVSRRVYPVRPPRVEYALTALGVSLLEATRSFLEWALDAHAEMTRARETFDRATLGR